MNTLIISRPSKALKPFTHTESLLEQARFKLYICECSHNMGKYNIHNQPVAAALGTAPNPNLNSDAEYYIYRKSLCYYVCMFICMYVCMYVYNIFAVVLWLAISLIQ